MNSSVVVHIAANTCFAAARPRATAFGAEAYPDLDAKAAALLHSLARSHALIDGDQRLALAATIAFCGVNGRLTVTNDEAYDLILDVATGSLDAVDEIAGRLRAATEPRRQASTSQPRTGGSPKGSRRQMHGPAQASTATSRSSAGASSAATG